MSTCICFSFVLKCILSLAGNKVKKKVFTWQKKNTFILGLQFSVIHLSPFLVFYFRQSLISFYAALTYS